MRVLSRYDCWPTPPGEPMRQCYPITVLIAFTVAICVTSHSARAQKAAKADTVMTITVTDKTTGEPVGAADISVQTESGQQKFKSDDSGRCDISVPSNPRYLSV